jgi:plasmid rolling circle replication initiator protein Rep
MGVEYKHIHILVCSDSLYLKGLEGFLLQSSWDTCIHLHLLTSEE